MNYTDSVALTEDSPYGVHDSLRNGFKTAKADLGLKHPVEYIENSVSTTFVWRCSKERVNEVRFLILVSSFSFNMDRLFSTRRIKNKYG